MNEIGVRPDHVGCRTALAQLAIDPHRNMKGLRVSNFVDKSFSLADVFDGSLVGA
jgi:hypothetical protein